MKAKKPKSRKKRIALAITVSSFLVLFSVFISLFSYYLCAGYLMYRDALDVKSLSEAVEEIRASEYFVPLEELPELYKDGVVAIEDSRFYSHGGIDIISIGRSILRNIKEMSLAAGGSTITQQLAKNLFFTFEKKFERKAAEVYMANLIESEYTKEEILELYVNCIDFGNGYRGIGQASLEYYGKIPADLTEKEIALMIGIPNKPSCFAPNLDPEESKKKQEEVYGKLVAAGLIIEE